MVGARDDRQRIGRWADPRLPAQLQPVEGVTGAVQRPGQDPFALLSDQLTFPLHAGYRRHAEHVVHRRGWEWTISRGTWRLRASTAAQRRAWSPVSEPSMPTTNPFAGMPADAPVDESVG